MNAASRKLVHTKNNLPIGWALAELDLLGEWYGGGTPSKSTARFWEGGTVPWASPKDMKSPVLRDTEDKITDSAVANSATKIIPSQSILMVTRSGILAHSFPVSVNEIPTTLNQDLKALWPAKGIDPFYVRYALQAAEQAILASCSKHGTTVHSIEFPRLKSFQIPVAPANEQTRIVAKLDELFSRIEKAQENLKRVQALVRQYRQSVFKAAVTGELTGDWREKHSGQGETGEQLLRRILAARRAAWEAAELKTMKAKGKTPKDDMWKLKYKEPEPPDTSDLPELPEGWVWATVEQLISGEDRSLQSGPFGSNLRHSEFQENGKLVIGIDNVQDGYFSIGSANRISDKKFRSLVKYKARPRDVLITVMATIGRTCVLPKDVEDAIITKHVYRITLNQNLVLPEYVHLCLWGGPAVRRQIFKNAQGQTRPGLNKSILERIALPLPSSDEQQRILRQVDEFVGVFAKLNEMIERETTKSEALRQSILRATSCGRLVPQDPNDEPASALLERIANERAALGAKKPKRGPRKKTREAAE